MQDVGADAEAVGLPWCSLHQSRRHVMPVLAGYSASMTTGASRLVNVEPYLHINIV